MSKLVLPNGFSSQPQYPAPLAPEFRAYNPAIVALPAASVANLATGKAISFANDATLRSGNFYFPGVDGYVDLGSDAIIGGSNYSFVVVSKLDSFANSFPVIFGAKNTINANLMAFYSNSGSYVDVTIGQNGTGVPFSLSQFGSVTGTWHKLAFVNSGGTSKLWCNGVSLTAGAAQALGGSTGNSCLGQLNPGSLANDFTGSIALLALFNGVIPDALARELSENPWRIFKAPARRLWVATTSSGINLIGANSSQANTSSTGAISQTHILTGANSTQADSSSTGAVTQTHVLAGSNSSQANAGSTGVVSQTHRLTGANASQANAASTGSINKGSLVAANCVQANLSGTGAVVVIDVYLPAANSDFVWLGTASGEC